ncbi:HAD superfamily hydrolase (TIGR01509 family) [Arthrobacter ginsengisoli]|uniref:HAD superfamily hydrolase (TIGR01509 family) n=1 Tax=Arthrobacter ginsengisoli TaxID=1356565 RepID=A0ABU1U6M2_9MICC|nr:HAD family phosphatase [Arthrobacter ginsengisoli]MDR7080805.1 HAD superfamily hydrolase (TIGR01509 family) [Arthrobacter ginsengisoli]
MRSPAPQPLLKAALWDMDGTIVDTEPYWIEAEHALVAAHGGHWSHEKAMQLVGQSLVFSAGILQDAGVTLERREIIDILTAQVISQVRTSVPWRPGARELLDELHSAGIRCALVTMSEAPLAREIVASLPKPYFDFLVTGDTVTRGKPHPEAYLRAVELLREQDPELGLHHCIALEDSVPGVASAVASGVLTVAIPHIMPLPHDSRHAVWDTLAGRTVADLEDLVALRHEFPDATFGAAAGTDTAPDGERGRGTAKVPVHD